jgi:hypothetical protein
MSGLIKRQTDSCENPETERPEETERHKDRKIKRGIQTQKQTDKNRQNQRRHRDRETKTGQLISNTHTNIIGRGQKVEQDHQEETMERRAGSFLEFYEMSSVPGRICWPHTTWLP